MSRNRQLEVHIQSLLARKVGAMSHMLEGMRQGGVLRLGEAEVPRLATSLVLVLTYWFSFEYVSDPRHALESESESPSIERGARQLLSLLSPHLGSGQRSSWTGWWKPARKSEVSGLVPSESEQRLRAGEPAERR